MTANLLSTASSSFQMLPANLTLILFAATAAFGQTADSPAPAFDVASVKASQPGQPGPGGGRGRRDNIQVSPGTVTMRNVSLKSSIRWAWHVSEFQVSGPDWLDSERYEITGKAPGAATEEQLRLMMQTLLRERFKLALHRQTKELSAYVLLVGKNGPKVQETKTEGEASIDINQRQLSVNVQRAPMSQLIDMMSNLLQIGKNGPKVQETKTEGEASIDINQRQLSVNVQRAPMSQLIDMMSNLLRAPVIDMTGLTGRYDLT